MENGEPVVESLPAVELVRAKTEDLETYIELEKSIGDTKTYSSMTDPSEALELLSNSKVYFIKEGDEIVGSISYLMKAPKHAYIDGILVTPARQGHGLGRAATIKALEELKDIPLVDLVTHPDNARAIQLYESLGFVIGERTENYFGDGEPRIRMILNRTP
jgi:ribosomal protein S18 acetylase RimI-like enzyme